MYVNMRHQNRIIISPDCACQISFAPAFHISSALMKSRHKPHRFSHHRALAEAAGKILGERLSLCMKTSMMRRMQLTISQDSTWRIGTLLSSTTNRRRWVRSWTRWVEIRLGKKKMDSHFWQHRRIRSSSTWFWEPESGSVHCAEKKGGRVVGVTTKIWSVYQRCTIRNCSITSCVGFVEYKTDVHNEQVWGIDKHRVPYCCVGLHFVVSNSSIGIVQRICGHSMWLKNERLQRK